jgi:hypothetical protein
MQKRGCLLGEEFEGRARANSSKISNFSENSLQMQPPIIKPKNNPFVEIEGPNRQAFQHLSQQTL